MNWFERYGISGMYFLVLITAWLYVFTHNGLFWIKLYDKPEIMAYIGGALFLPMGYIVSVFSQYLYYRGKWPFLKKPIFFQIHKKSIAEKEFGQFNHLINETEDAIEADMSIRYRLTQIENDNKFERFQNLQQFITKRWDVFAIDQILMVATFLAPIITAFFIVLSVLFKLDWINLHRNLVGFLGIISLLIFWALYKSQITFYEQLIRVYKQLHGYFPLIMTVKFHHVPFESTNGINAEISQKINTKNELLVNRVNQTIQIKSDKEVLFYFDRTNKRLGDVGDKKAQVYSRSWEFDTPPKSIARNIQDKNWDYLVYISKDVRNPVRNPDDGIYKTCVFAHEFQHIKQYETDKYVWKLGVMLLRGTKLEYWQIPMEYEANRFAKKIMIDRYGEPAIQDWINKKIRESSDKNEEAHWNRLDGIDLNNSYPVLEESKRLWKQHKSEIAQFKKELEDRIDNSRHQPKDIIKAKKQIEVLEELNSL